MDYDFDKQLDELEKKIRDAAPKDRLRYHPMVQKMVDGIAARGKKVPLRLSRINADLADEAFEEKFDNMPL